MGFKRALLSNASQTASPSYAGDGLMANFNMTVFNTTTPQTLDVSQISGGNILHAATLGATVTYTLPTAAALLASPAFASMDNGDSYSFVVTNAQAAAFGVIIAVGSGMIAQGNNNSLTVSAGSSRIFTLVKSSATTFNLY